MGDADIGTAEQEQGPSPEDNFGLFAWECVRVYGRDASSTELKALLWHVVGFEPEHQGGCNADPHWFVPNTCSC